MTIEEPVFTVSNTVLPASSYSTTSSFPVLSKRPICNSFLGPITGCPCDDRILLPSLDLPM